MAIPTIYCDKKQARPGDEITVIASIGSGEWEFPNALSGDIEIVSGTLESNVLTFKCLGVYDPLTISFKVIEDKVFNGSSWTDEINSGVYGDDVLADGWTTPSGQENMILTGWNFEGRSQRINQTLSGVPAITQANLTVSGEQYGVEIDYRAYTDIELKVGGHTFELSATNEGPPFAIYPILHDSGLVNFEVSGGSGVKWLLADGSVDYGTVVSTTILGGTSYLIVDDFTTTAITSLETGTNYVGSLSDIPSGVSIIEFENTNISGDIIEIAHIQDVVYISNAAIYGEVNSLYEVSSVINLSGCSDVEGVIDDLEYTDTIILDGTSVSGVATQYAEGTYWSLDNTNLTKEELEETMFNIATRAVMLNIHDGYFRCYDNMPTVDSADACWALGQLRYRDWTVEVHYDCGGSGS
jgi:hypothetical protein